MVTTTDKDKAEAVLLKAQKLLHDYILDHPLIAFLHGRGFLVSDIYLENILWREEVKYLIHIRPTLRIIRSGESTKYGKLVVQTIFSDWPEDIILTEVGYKIEAVFKDLLMYKGE